ncbi:MAG: non-ribosomal peptide synthetase, partial [Fibrobacter sp.]|nr:non-ribosomal peptide synthetase [Fibrobacter sp.]
SINVSSQSFTDTGPVQFSLSINSAMYASQLIQKVHQMAIDNNSIKWLNSDTIHPFMCRYNSDTGNCIDLTLLFEQSISGNLIISQEHVSSRNGLILNWDIHLQNIIRELTLNPSTPIGRINILSELELSVIKDLSTSVIDQSISVPESLIDLFEKTVRKFPKNPAIRIRGSEINYDEFNRRTDAIAIYLSSCGIKKGSHISILLPRCEEIFLAIIGILKSGAAYVPIDPRSPADRIKYILDDCKAEMIITDASLYNQNNLNTRCLLIENFPEIYKNQMVSTQVTADITPDNTAYIIYTSGTTGKPKGVVITHRTVSNLIKAESYLFKVTNFDRVYQGFSVSFDASVEEMWLAWYSGAVLIAATKAEALSGPDLTDFLKREKITVFSTVPTQISMMQNPVDTVRILILGGEECFQKAIEPWLDGSRQVFNTYGPTEATVIATCGICKKGVKPGIGKPIPNYAIYILDKNMQPVPPGFYGELCIGGHCLAKGYLNREELTSSKFIESPFKIGHGFPQRLYRSGDRARFNSDGTIEFGGRIDDQIKLRGQRIELGEIEAAIIKNAKIRQAAAAVINTSQNIQSLVAYIVPEDLKTFSEHALKESLKNFLPSYMIPNQFLIIEELPRLQSGKVDRKKLKSLKSEVINTAKELVLPRNETESLILNIWTKYFDRKDISVTDDFFDIGGHSLLAATIISELRTIPGLQSIPLQYIYQYRTIESLARMCHCETSSGI